MKKGKIKMVCQLDLRSQVKRETRLYGSKIHKPSRATLNGIRMALTA